MKADRSKSAKRGKSQAKREEQLTDRKQPSAR